MKSNTEDSINLIRKKKKNDKRIEIAFNDRDISVRR